MTRNVLDDRHHAAGDETVGNRTAQRDHLRNRFTIGTIADDLVCAGHRQIQHRHAIGINTQILQVLRQETRDKVGIAASFFGLFQIERTIGAGRRQGSPQRRAQTLDAAALLIDQHQGIVTTNGGAGLRDKAADLVVMFQIARKQDDTCRACVGQETMFVSA